MLETRSSRSTSASLSTAARHAHPSRILRALICSTIERASWRDSGIARKATSSRISTKMPPRPNIITGPKIGSRLTPMMTSVPFRAIGVTSTPRMVAEGQKGAAGAHDLV